VKAVILVGGEGTRLRPLTETVPKPLLPLMNRPFLDHQLEHVAGHGVEEVILSSSYREEHFARYLAARTGPPRVTWMTEPEPLGTAGAVAAARGHLDGTFLVLNGDVLTDLDLGALIRFHGDREAVATIALTHVDDARPFGLVERDDDGRVRAFREKPADPIPGDINAGTYVLEPRALDGVPDGVMVSIERETYPGLIARGEPVYASLAAAYWRDLGTPAAYLAAHLDALGGKVAGRRYERPLVAEGATVDPGASVGRDVVVGPGARIGSGASVRRAVLHAGVTVGEGAAVEGSILGEATVVEPGATVTDSVLAEGARVAADARVADALVGAGQVAG
jgi:mannose-1-phosphate guanylyltransferase